MPLLELVPVSGRVYTKLEASRQTRVRICYLFFATPQQNSAAHHVILVKEGRNTIADGDIGQLVIRVLKGLHLM